MSSAQKTETRTYRGRIVEIDDVLPDTRILGVELENRQRLSFRAGQYALLGLPALDYRPFSIASSPDAPLLEFHIRNSGQGISQALCTEAVPGTALSIEAPLGDSHWRSRLTPMVALAGGLGIAPLKAIIETHLAPPDAPPCHLYWGVRHEEQLYLDGFFRMLAHRHTQFRYVPVISEPAAATRFRTGFVSAAMAEDFETLAGLDVYMAGPPPMVAATLPALLHHGADKDSIFSDIWAP